MGTDSDGDPEEDLGRGLLVWFNVQLPSHSAIFGEANRPTRVTLRVQEVLDYRLLQKRRIERLDD